MAKLIYGLQQSLDGYVDHTEMGPTPALFRYFTEHVRNLAGSVYGRVTYGLMRYWDVDQPDWGAAEIDFAAAWGGTPFFAGPRPALRLVASDRIGDDAIRLTYVPARTA
jgi:hypothetical protein